MATWNLSAFSIALLQKLKAPTSSNNINLVNAWQLAEGGSGIGAAQRTPTTYNPLNTVMPGFGGKPTPGYSAGIMSYPSFGAGVDATAAAITNTPAYSGILAALRASAPPSQTAATISGAPGWTTFSYGGTPPSTTTLQGGNIPKGGFPQSGGFDWVHIVEPWNWIPSGSNPGLSQTVGGATGAVGNALGGGAGKTIGTAVGSANSSNPTGGLSLHIGGYVKEAAIIGIGIILVFMGLWIMFRDSGDNKATPSVPSEASEAAPVAGGDEVEAAALA